MYWGWLEVHTPGLLSSLIGVAGADDELPPVGSILSALGVQVTNGLFSMCLQGLGVLRSRFLDLTAQSDPDPDDCLAFLSKL